MLIQQQSAPVRSLESPEEFSETRLEAIGFIFHGTIADANGKAHAGRSPSNLLHFARCAKLEKVGDNRDEDLVSLRASGHQASRRAGRAPSLEVVQDLRTRDHPADP